MSRKHVAIKKLFIKKANRLKIKVTCRLCTLFEIHGLCLLLSCLSARYVASWRASLVIRSSRGRLPASSFRLSLPLSACASLDRRSIGMRGLWRYALARRGLVHNHWLSIRIRISRRIMTHRVILWGRMPRHAWTAWTTLLRGRRLRRMLGMLRMMGISWIHLIGRVHHIMLRRIWLVDRLRTSAGRVKRPWCCKDI